MSNDDKKVKTAVEVCREISRSLRKKLDQHKKSLQKTEFSPREVGLKVTKVVLDQINEYKENLIKIQKVEDGELLEKVTPENVPESVVHKLKEQYGYSIPEEKRKVHATAWKISKEKGNKKTSKSEDVKKEESEPGIPSAPAKSNAQLEGQFKLKKNIFNVLAGKPAYGKPCKSMEKDEDSPEIHDKGEKSTSDDTEADAHPIDTKAAKERHPEAKLPGDKESIKQEKRDQGSGGQIKPGKKLKKNQSSIFAKAMPKLSGKDPGSKMMTQHAMIGGSAAEAKNKKMPAAQQSTKMPSPAEHSSRASSLSEFTPAGKWSKSEWDSEKCSYCQKNMHDGEC